MSNPRLRTPALELLGASFLVLFLELALIRWLGGQVRVIAYFPNLVLLAAFLGLGVGCLRVGRASLLPAWPPALLALVAAAWGMSHVAFTQESVSEHLWLLYHDLPQDAPVVHGVHLPIVATFVLTTLAFAPLGQYVAERLQTFQRESSSLWGYCWDLGGSFLGVVAFSAVSFSGAFPVVWFALVLGLSGAEFLRRPNSRWVFLACAALVLGLVARAEKAQFYSPYYALRAEVSQGHVVIQSNGSLHQVATPLAMSDTMLHEDQAVIREGYHTPHRLLLQPPDRALVLGAGSGNDVAVLLDEGAGSVDAVEIDPVILSLGRQHHANQPYASERVRARNTDARSFLNDSADRYDLIVFGTLDSMTRLSALSNVRLDNFVYTLDSIRAAREHLTERGGLVMYFMVGTDFIDQRLRSVLAEAFGQPPIVLDRPSFLFNRIYLAGPAFEHLRGNLPERATDQPPAPGLKLPTDDWPYLYLREPGLSPFYTWLIALFAGLAMAAVALASPGMRETMRGRGADLEMFLFGLAFLLMETKLVTEMNLVWGATWLTSAVVFASILLVVLASTVVMQVRPLPWAVVALGLAGFLVLNWLVPVHLLAGRPVPVRLLLSALFVGTPVFFAGAAFALRFKTRPAVDVAFGWNLLGAVAGGLLEFLSMAVGLKVLSLVALAAYLGAFALAARRVRGA